MTWHLHADFVLICQLLFDVNEYLSPEEDNVELLRLYYQFLYSGKLRPCWSPVLYLLAVHHVNRFMYTQDRSHSKLKASMMASILSTKNVVWYFLQTIIHIFYIELSIDSDNSLLLYSLIVRPFIFLLIDLRISFLKVEGKSTVIICYFSTCIVLYTSMSVNARINVAFKRRFPKYVEYAAVSAPPKN